MMRLSDGAARCVLLAPLVLLGCDETRDIDNDAGRQDASVEAAIDGNGPDQSADSRRDGPAEEDSAVVDRRPGRWDVVAGPGPKVTHHTATVLADGRRVLVVGGRQIDPDHGKYDPKIIGEAWLYSLDDDAFIPAGQLHVARAAHTAALLPNGKVLVVGGEDGAERSLSSSEIFDPASFDKEAPQKAWSLGPALLSGSRSYHAAVSQQDGTVLLIGGEGSADARSVEIFDWQAGDQGEWQVPAALMNTGRSALGAAALETGHVVIAGGFRGSSEEDTVEVFNPRRGSFALLEQTLSTAKAWPTLSVFRNSEGREQVLIVGGEGRGTTRDEVFDPSFDTVTAVGHPGGAPGGHTAVVLRDGRVMVAGGETGEGVQAQAVAFDPTGVPPVWRLLAPLHIERKEHRAVRLADGSVLAVGGTQGEALIERPERFVPGPAAEPPALPKLNWDKMDSGTTERLEAVWGTGPDRVIAVGNYVALLEYRSASGQWTPMDLPEGAGGTLYGIHGTAAGRIFVVGSDAQVWRYDGEKWLIKKDRVTNGADLRGIWVQRHLIHAVGTRGTILRSTDSGEQWETMDSPLPDEDLYAVRRCGSDGLYAVGSGATLLRLVGDAWEVVQPVPTGYGDLMDMWCGDSLPLFAVGHAGTIYRFGTDGWNAMGSRSSSTIFGVAGDSSGALYAGGGYGFVRYANAGQYSWFDVGAEALTDDTNVRGMWTGGGQVFAVGDDGMILRAQLDTE